jgi:hypothetical protein
MVSFRRRFPPQGPMAQFGTEQDEIVAGLALAEMAGGSKKPQARGLRTFPALVIENVIQLHKRRPADRTAWTQVSGSSYIHARGGGRLSGEHLKGDSGNRGGAMNPLPCPAKTSLLLGRYCYGIRKEDPGRPTDRPHRWESRAKSWLALARAGTLVGRWRDWSLVVASAEGCPGPRFWSSRKLRATATRPCSMPPGMSWRGARPPSHPRLPREDDHCGHARPSRIGSGHAHALPEQRPTRHPASGVARARPQDPNLPAIRPTLNRNPAFRE